MIAGQGFGTEARGGAGDGGQIVSLQAQSFFISS